jgi:hypothetical protein
MTASELKSNGESDLLWIRAFFRVEPGRLRPVLSVDERLSICERVSVVEAVLRESGMERLQSLGKGFR